MRLLALFAIVSLALAPGCMVLAIPPTVGATGGALLAGAENAGGHHASVVGHAAAGALLGVVIDALMVVAAAVSIGSALDGPHSCGGCD